MQEEGYYFGELMKTPTGFRVYRLTIRKDKTFPNTLDSGKGSIMGS